jgi:carboxymethylenebutenolidase
MLISDSLVDLETPTGTMRTYLYQPVSESQKFPGIVMFSEIFQQTGPIKRTAALLAGHGFVVAVPEIFHELNPIGTVLAYDQAGADKGNKDKVSKPVSAYDADARCVIEHLLKHSQCNGKLGALGICIGGHLAFRCAMNPQILAAVCFYATDIHKGSLGLGGDDTLARIKEIKGELLMLWGKQDPHIPLEGRQRVYQALTEAGTTFTWHEFNGQHAFIRDEGARYDAELAFLCQRMAIDLLRRACS